MTAKQYQELARRTQNKELSDSERLFHAVFGLASEAGEVSGIMQKMYQGHESNDETIMHILKELGDCLWMISEACDALDVPLDAVMELNIEKLMERYPEGFDPEKSMHRKEGDI